MITLKTLDSWAIHAYADGELEDRECEQIENILAQDPRAQELLEAVMRQKRVLKTAYDSVLDESIPPSLLRAASYQEKRRGPPYIAIAAAIVMLALGMAGGWFANRYLYISNDALLSDRALTAYNLFSTERDYPAKGRVANRSNVGDWLSKKIGAEFKVPDLVAVGYNFLGGRLLMEGSMPAGLLIYENSAKRRLAIYVASSESGNEDTLSMRQVGKLVTCYWLEPDLAYALIGEETQEAMLSLAKVARAGFDS